MIDPAIIAIGRSILVGKLRELDDEQLDELLPLVELVHDEMRAERTQRDLEASANPRQIERG